MDKVSDAPLTPAIPNAVESLPLAESLLTRYNDAVKLIAEGRDERLASPSRFRPASDSANLPGIPDNCPVT
jgi:hypothetical protein